MHNPAGLLLAAAQHTKRQAQQPAGVLRGGKPSKMRSFCFGGLVGGQHTKHTVTRHNGASNTCRAEVSQIPVSVRLWRHRQRHRCRKQGATRPLGGDVPRGCATIRSTGDIWIILGGVHAGRKAPADAPERKTGLNKAFKHTHTHTHKTPHAVTPKGRTSASGSRGSS